MFVSIRPRVSICRHHILNLRGVSVVFDKMASPGGNSEFCWNPPSEKTLAKSSYEGFSLCHFGGEVKYDDLVSNTLIRAKFQPL